MKILAIEKEVPGVDWSTVSKELLAQEALDVYRMYLKEQVREHYFNEEKCAVLVLECESRANAQELLGKLPLVANNLVTFETTELLPYTGYDRLVNAIAQQ
ncbi:MAG TPA: hypothetical protein VEB40_08955 [Flavipsychrobacter sp.]|nr:hypothetical protein [Flavipsychrobacter sp.]